MNDINATINGFTRPVTDVEWVTLGGIEMVRITTDATDFEPCDQHEVMMDPEKIKGTEAEKMLDQSP